MITEIVQKSIHFNDEKEYKLICFTIMPNHVHVVLNLSGPLQIGKSFLQSNVTQPFEADGIIVSKILQSIKGYSAREANKILNRKGSSWQSESYAHIVRDEDELEKIIKYVIYNPVRAKLVDLWEYWKFTYLGDDW